MTSKWKRGNNLGHFGTNLEKKQVERPVVPGRAVQSNDLQTSNWYCFSIEQMDKVRWRIVESENRLQG